MGPNQSITKGPLQSIKISAVTDYETAREFPVPQRFWVIRVTDTGAAHLPVTRLEAVKVLRGLLVLFEDAMQALEPEAQGVWGMGIPQRPLVCITGLLRDAAGRLTPTIDYVRPL